MTQKWPIAEPGIPEMMDLHKRDVFASFNCVSIGSVTAFDGTKKLASIKILFKRSSPDGSVQSIPLLVGCPVVTLQGGGAAVQMPVAAGDTALVFFSDRNLGNWLNSGSEALPPDGRMHDLSDAVALVGLNALNSSLGATPTDRVKLSFGGAEIDILSTGRVSIKNGSANLLTLLQNLCTILEGLTVQGPGTYPLTTASITAITNYATTLAGLLV